MIQVEQIAVQVEMLVLVHLDRGVSRFLGPSARRKIHLGKQAERRHCHLGQALGGEFSIIDDHLQGLRVRGLLPMGLERRRHVVVVGEKVLRLCCWRYGSVNVSVARALS